MGAPLALALVTVLVNAVVGALRGYTDTEREWDIVGISAFALLMGLGGGLIRDVLIGNLPAESLRSPWYLVTVMVGIALVLLVEGYKVWYYLRELWEEASERFAMWALKRLDRLLDRGIPPGRTSRSLLSFAEHVILRHEAARGHELLGRVRSRVDSE